MARPPKQNAEYFPHNANMRNDVKVKALRRKFGYGGYGVWCCLLETLTDANGFELDYNELNIELWAADFDVTPELLREIIDYCCLIGLLQCNDDKTRVWSDGLKLRLSPLTSKRERSKERYTKQQEHRELTNVTGVSADFCGKERVSADFCGKERVSADFCGISFTNSKVKESKVKESKVNTTKVVDSNILYPYRDIVAMWNSICKSLPQVKALNEGRRKKIKSRLLEMAPNDPQLWLDKCRALFERVQTSPFLTGDNDKEWTASFDWLFSNGNNWVKVIEGNYDHGRDGATQPRTTHDGATLGVGEFIDPTGRRTYGTGKATIPPTAPARPSERHSWDSKTQSWILL